jgi:signal transduction histidine kinase/ligand-binding sensor domain-containing protein
MKLWRRIIFSGTALLALAQTGRGQSASYWRVYKVDDGMHQSACVSVSVAPNGTVVVLHRNRSFATELDGYSVKSISMPEPAGNVSEGPGGQLWATVQNGLLQEVKPGDWLAHPIPDIAAESNSAAAFYPAPRGHVLFLCDDRLMDFNVENPERPQIQVLIRCDRTRLGKFTDMVAARDGGLWITGERGLGKVSKLDNAWWSDYLPTESPPIHNLREPREDDEGGVTVVAESTAGGQAVVARFDGTGWTAQPAGAEKIRCAWRSDNKALWVLTSDALLQQAPGETKLTEDQDVSARRYHDMAMEPGGTFWLATSAGLFHYAPPLWRNPHPLQQLNSLVHCLANDNAGRLWFVAAGQLHSLQDETHREFALPEPATHDAQSVRALFPLKDGTLLLDAIENPLRFNPDSGTFGPGLHLRNGARHIKPLGLLRDGSLGVLSWNTEAVTGKCTTCYFDRFDGVQYQPLTETPPDPDAVGTCSTLFAARNGDLWLSGDKGMAWYHENKWRTFPVSDRAVPEVVLFFTELPDGRIWCATQNELWEFNGHDWSSMHASFDHINALQCARDGSVWVADDAGVHRYFQKVWIENNREDGLPDATVHEIFEDQHGNIWAGTPHGLSRYHPEADLDPPCTFVEKPDDRELRVREGDLISLGFSGQDKWKFTSRDRLLYSYKLDYRDWSPFTETHTFSFSDLPAGRHVCQARTMDRNGNIDPKPAQFEFVVTLPWYREIRLVLIALAGALVALFFAALAFNRHRQLLRSYAEVEKKIAERTRELEAASQELLHSQKMKALGTLAAGIAHDFNNILSIIKGSAQLIEENPDNPQKIRTRVDRIKTVVEQGAGIVNAMLGFSGGAGEQPAPCDLNAVTKETLKLLGDRFLREVEVKFEPAQDLPEAWASKNFIQQILLNFIFNAAEAMTTHKQLILATQRLERLPGGLALTPPLAAGYVSVSVRDFGCGIPPENLPRIFEPFFTTKALSTRRGTGLGLSMVYELAKKMETGLAVESVVDRGSTFTLILPVRERPPEAKA